jgi:thymidylate kinase
MSFLPTCSFNQEVERDLRLVPDGFVYLRAAPEICMQRMRRR